MLLRQLESHTCQRLMFGSGYQRNVQLFQIWFVPGVWTKLNSDLPAISETTRVFLQSVSNHLSREREGNVSIECGVQVFLGYLPKKLKDMDLQPRL